MSKQRKTERHSEQAKSTPEATVEATEEALLGNRAVAEQLGGVSHAAPELGLDAVREVAFPLIERASLALHLEPKPAGEMERLVAILERSHFDRAHKDALIDRIEGDQAAALAVEDSLVRALGDVDDAMRSELIDVLDQAWRVLHEGTPGADSWAHADGALALSSASLEGSAADRAGGLIADLVAGLASDTLKEGLADRGGSESVARFCRSVVLAYAFDEEEEEEQAAVQAPEET